MAERDIQANDVQAKSFKGNEIGARFEAVQPFQPGFNDISRERRFTAAINAYSLRCASAVLITMYRKSKITGWILWNQSPLQRDRTVIKSARMR